MATRDSLHSLIDDLPEALIEEAERRLMQLRDDPVLRAFLEAPEDGEPLTEEDIAAIEEAKAEIARGEVYTLEEVAQRLRGTD